MRLNFLAILVVIPLFLFVGNSSCEAQQKFRIYPKISSNKKVKKPVRPKLKQRLGRGILRFAEKSENKKLVAITLAITLGPFGAHRLYLGTNEKVPVAYALTLGGGLGILPLIDIITIITAKDLSKYENSPKVFMWATE